MDRKLRTHELKKVGRGVKYCIIIQCPICGREGRLQRWGNGFKVSHDSFNNDICPVGYSNENFEEVKELYYRYRGNKR